MSFLAVQYNAGTTSDSDHMLTVNNIMRSYSQRNLMLPNRANNTADLLSESEAVVFCFQQISKDTETIITKFEETGFETVKNGSGNEVIALDRARFRDIKPINSGKNYVIAQATDKLTGKTVAFASLNVPLDIPNKVEFIDKIAKETKELGCSLSLIAFNNTPSEKLEGVQTICPKVPTQIFRDRSYAEIPFYTEKTNHFIEGKGEVTTLTFYQKIKSLFVKIPSSYSTKEKEDFYPLLKRKTQTGREVFNYETNVSNCIPIATEINVRYINNKMSTAARVAIIALLVLAVFAIIAGSCLLSAASLGIIPACLLGLGGLISSGVIGTVLVKAYYVKSHEEADKVIHEKNNENMPFKKSLSQIDNDSDDDEPRSTPRVSLDLSILNRPKQFPPNLFLTPDAIMRPGSFTTPGIS